MCKLKH